MTEKETQMAAACAKVHGWKRSGKHWLDLRPSRERILDAPLALSKYHPWLDDAESLKQATEVLVVCAKRCDLVMITHHHIEGHWCACLKVDLGKFSSYDGEGKTWNSALCDAVVKMESEVVDDN